MRWRLRNLQRHTKPCGGRVTSQKIGARVSEREAMTIGATPRNVETEALVDTTADVLPTVRERILPIY